MLPAVPAECTNSPIRATGCSGTALCDCTDVTLLDCEWHQCCRQSSAPWLMAQFFGDPVSYQDLDLIPIDGSSDKDLSPSDFSIYRCFFLSLLYSSADLKSSPFSLSFLSCSIGGFVKTWLPFVLFLGAILTVVLTLHLR